MGKIWQGRMQGEGRRFALVVSRFNELVSGKLLEGALDVLRRHGCDDGDLDVAWVPGAFEIPLFARKLASSGRYDGLVCLGCLIRGATPHFEYISAQVARGVAKVSEETGIPAAFGVLTCDTQDQALERAGSKGGNKGAEAAMAVLESADLRASLEEDLGGA